MKYSTGYVRDPNRPALKSFSAHRFASLPYGPKNDMSPFAPGIYDQGQTGSCVGHARSRGLYTSAKAVGNLIPFIPSPADIYRLARCYEYAGQLQDNGCDPYHSILAISKFGMRPMGPMAPDGRYSDADPATINVRPTLDDLESDFPNMSDGDYQINSSGNQRVQEVLTALNHNMCVCIDVSGGSDAWQNYSTGVISATGDPNDHYVCLVGYDTTSGAVFVGHNSWGTSWGLSGQFHVDASVIQAATDLIVNVYHLEH